MTGRILKALPGSARPPGRLLALAVMILAVPGCGLGGEDRWVEAPLAELMERREALQDGLDEDSFDGETLACDGFLASARAALEEPAAPMLKRLVKVCARVGLGFGDELRCADGRLEVRCL